MERVRNNQKGYTLVEIIVTFALTALFLAASSTVLGSFMSSYADVNAVAQAESVAATLMQTISGELGAAQQNQTLDPAQPEVRMKITASGSRSVVDYVNYNGYHVTMQVDGDGHLQMIYAGGETDPASGSAADTAWNYGERVYNGFHIDTFTVAKTTSGVNRNCLKVTLKLVSDRVDGVAYTTERIFHCYNLTEEQISI